MTPHDFLREKTACVDRALSACLESYAMAPPGLVEAMRYSLFAGGKRLRPALALGACELICGEDAPAIPAACALEMIHTYSLIHDDLPAMDNDDLRRGRPTAHCRFNEATAILSGDALLTMAFYELSKAGRPDAIGDLALAAGVSGMAGGQYLDMQAEGRPIDLAEMSAMHALKTGALIRASLRLGALFGHADEKQTHALGEYGRALGLLFQITDDILDVTGSAAVLGKSIGKDQASRKAAYPALLGLDGARCMARHAAKEAHDALDLFGNRAEIFRELVCYVEERDH